MYVWRSVFIIYSTFIRVTVKQEEFQAGQTLHGWKLAFEENHARKNKTKEATIIFIKHLY